MCHLFQAGTRNDIGSLKSGKCPLQRLFFLHSPEQSCSMPNITCFLFLFSELVFLELLKVDSLQEKNWHSQYQNIALKNLKGIAKTIQYKTEKTEKKVSMSYVRGENYFHQLTSQERYKLNQLKYKLCFYSYYSTLNLDIGRQSETKRPQKRELTITYSGAEH